MEGQDGTHESSSWVGSLSSYSYCLCGRSQLRFLNKTRAQSEAIHSQHHCTYQKKTKTTNQINNHVSFFPDNSEIVMTSVENAKGPFPSENCGRVGKQMIQAASRGHFQTFSFLLPRLRMQCHNPVTKLICFIGLSLLWYVIFRFLIADFEGPQSRIDTCSHKAFHQCPQHLISWDSSPWLVRVGCFSGWCFNSQHLCLLADFGHWGSAVWDSFPVSLREPNPLCPKWRGTPGGAGLERGLVEK